MKRIVITGMGLLSPVGHNVTENWENIKAGISGIAPITRLNTDKIETHIGGEVKDFDPGKFLGHKEARRMDRFAQFAIVCAQEAAAQGNYTITAQNTFETAVIVGAGFGGAETLQEGLDTLYTTGARRVKPLTFPSVIGNMGAAQIAMNMGIRGVNYSIAAACATSGIAIGEAAALIQRGDAEVAFAGGSEASFARFSMVGLNAMRALTHSNGDPTKASRPFDATRDGFVPSEGAGVLMLESLDHAQGRGAPIFAELVGYGCTCDAAHVTAPDPEGTAVAYAMRSALKKAGLTIHDIDYINAHGTSTPINDSQETTVIKMVFGEHAYKIPISSTKSMTGHAMSSSGVFEAVYSIMAMRDGIIPPTINYEHPDPDCDLDYVPNVPRKAALRHVMSNSFGFGGQNAVLIFKKWEG